MKNNCIGIADLLCAYADGELPESSRQTVEDHLLICENCSAILKIYNEMSKSIDDTNVSAPESLRIGVMNRINNEEIDYSKETKKQRGRYFYILTRFAPVAACLVVMLLVWQVWGDNIFNRNGAMPAAAPADAPVALSINEEFDTELYAQADMSEGSGAGAFDDSGMPAPAPEAAAAPAEAPESRIQLDDSLTDEEAANIVDYIGRAGAEIMITGELPAFLAGYEPQPFGSWSGWEMVFEIPISEVQNLLDEIGNREGIEVIYNDHNSSSGYAVVFFSPGR